MNNITFYKGNIFNSKTQTIVNTINCVGVMGKGIALIFRLRYPEMFEKYKKFCQSNMIDIGKLWLYKSEKTSRWILNFPTKLHWRYPSKMEYLEVGLQKFVDSYKTKGITSIAFPLLGTHNGKLNKIDVLNIMYKYLEQCDIPIEIYEYDPLAPDDIFENFKFKWIELSHSDKIKILGNYSSEQIEIINKAVNEDNINSMNALIEYQGIEFMTIQRCFDFAMRISEKLNPII